MNFILCADDFALTDGISRGILRLLERRRLSAAGAMTTRPGWAVWARELAPFRAGADLGVHLNLTAGSPLGQMPALAPTGTFPAVSQLVRSALLVRTPVTEIAGEFGRQIDAFRQATGHNPDFIDGHQHVHALPGVRYALFQALDRTGLIGQVYVRDPADAARAIRRGGPSTAKALTVAGLALSFGRAARKRGCQVNDGFAGFSPFDPDRDVVADLETSLNIPGPRHLVMCHPGEADDAIIGLDTVIETRPIELAALMGARFEAMLADRGARIVRFSELSG